MKYKRLTERAGKGISIKETSTNDNMSIWNAIERLCELEDKIEQGKMIELPCKVGDTIYLIFEERWSVGKKETHWYIRKTKLTYGNMERVIKEYGEFVFLTREEAEKKLKELQNG